MGVKGACPLVALIPYCHIPMPPTGEEDATNINTAGKTTHEHKTEEINAKIKT